MSSSSIWANYYQKYGGSFSGIGEGFHIWGTEMVLFISFFTLKVTELIQGILPIY